MSFAYALVRGTWTRRRASAVSLVEVLVVISIVVLLLAMLLPGFSFARQKLRRVVCANNLRQWGAALQYYRDDFDDHLPTEGTYVGGGINKPGTWFNALPPYLGLPPYRDFEGVGDAIEELPGIHVWICPSKNMTTAYKSFSGKNQFHYGMNQVLDGLGKEPDGSKDTPGFPDLPAESLRGSIFTKRPTTVFLFDIAPNSPAGTPRSVATKYQSFRGRPIGRFHGDFANLLTLGGGVVGATTDDLVADRDFKKGRIIWNHPQLYWGYPPP